LIILIDLDPGAVVWRRGAHLALHAHDDFSAGGGAGRMTIYPSPVSDFGVNSGLGQGKSQEVSHGLLLCVVMSDYFGTTIGQASIALWKKFIQVWHWDKLIGSSKPTVRPWMSSFDAFASVWMISTCKLPTSMSPPSLKDG
jgi:hypothetical protein